MMCDFGSGTHAHTQNARPFVLMSAAGNMAEIFGKGNKHSRLNHTTSIMRLCLCLAFVPNLAISWQIARGNFEEPSGKATCTAGPIPYSQESKDGAKMVTVRVDTKRAEAISRRLPGA